jgi:exodeoxyribonuclease VII large subunit
MSGRKHITLSQLQAEVARALGAALPLPVWVAAEIGELRVNRGSGHCYMELVEKGGANGVPRARVSAVVWRGQWGVLRSYFASATGSEPAAGMQVLLRATVTYHELYGLSLTVSDIDPLYTLGDMERRRQETVARLKDEGVWDMNRTLELPRVVQRVAVVSSAGAAGYQDFMNELGASGYRFSVTLFDAVMQGNGAEESIVDALGRVDTDDFDVLVIIRGGGAQSDLAAFDSYRLASHVAQFPLPVATGIGHDKDRSIADMVAAVPLKTPTAVAAWLAAGLAEFEATLDGLEGATAQAAAAVLEREKRRLRDAVSALSTVGTAIAHARVRLEVAGAALRERAAAALSRERARLDLLAAAAAARRPEAILALGFAIVRRDGAAVTDASTLRPGDRLEIELAKGRTEAVVDRRSPDYDLR